MKCCIRPAGLSTDFTGTTTKEAWEEEALDEHWNRFKGNVGKTSETQLKNLTFSNDSTTTTIQLWKRIFNFFFYHSRMITEQLQK